MAGADMLGGHLGVLCRIFLVRACCSFPCLFSRQEWLDAVLGHVDICLIDFNADAAAVSMSRAWPWMI